ncbi:hypothetical protein HPB52_025277 [Rhipicephalus sanguineus]|uniref:Uncharacterized protein n=1 Tax=Rhipicephalus sanguineus TaxID=34632 RepID=A0A9D4YRG6_RHISA|nr:hypothetical protein HPB52_025277 [Rhipicephalus sanguineus]
MFMEVKPPDNETLATLVPDVWFELMDELLKQRLKVMTTDIENIQLRILEQLTVGNDAPPGQTSRDLFLAKFEAFVKENTPGSRVCRLYALTTTPEKESLTRSFALFKRRRREHEHRILQQTNLYIPASLFVTTIGTGPEVSHVGDTPDQRMVASEIPTSTSNRMMRTTQQNVGGSPARAETETSATAQEAKEEDKSVKILQLLDGIVRLYCLCGHAQFVKASAVERIDSEASRGVYKLIMAR